MASSLTRKVSRILTAQRTLEGEGFLVHRAFPSHTLLDFDPFLLLDEMGPMDTKPGEAKGAPDHPHRGFETVTYMLAGTFKHQDSFGNAGRLEPGDVQWMTAGSGLIHSEMPDEEFIKKGGLLHGIQLWVNLPKSEKMSAPSYQEIKAQHIPEGVTDDGKVKIRVIAGEALKANAIIKTRTPIFYFHATILPGGTWVQPIPPDFKVFAYILKGEGMFSRMSNSKMQLGETHQMLIFDDEGEIIEIQSSQDAKGPLELLLIGGVPLRETVVRYGPFVMNTEEEIRQAFIDYHAGRMGTIVK